MIGQHRTALTAAILALAVTAAGCSSDDDGQPRLKSTETESVFEESSPTPTEEISAYSEINGDDLIAESRAAMEELTSFRYEEFVVVNDESSEETRIRIARNGDCEGEFDTLQGAFEFRVVSGTEYFQMDATLLRRTWGSRGDAIHSQIDGRWLTGVPVDNPALKMVDMLCTPQRLLNLVFQFADHAGLVRDTVGDRAGKDTMTVAIGEDFADSAVVSEDAPRYLVSLTAHDEAVKGFFSEFDEDHEVEVPDRVVSTSDLGIDKQA